MCLHTKNEIKTADKDIKCYKVLQSIDGVRFEIPSYRYMTEKEKGTEYLTPYRYYPMNLGETYTDEEDFYSPYRDTNGIADIGGDYFHSFATIAAAVEAIGDCEMLGAIVVECVIPKGTKYYEGCMYYSQANNGEVHTYASKTLSLTNTIVAKTNNPKEGEVYTLSYDGKEYRLINDEDQFSTDKSFALHWVEVEKALA